MNGADFVADTNALLYLLCGNDCMRPYLSKRLGVSVISEMELLSFPQASEQEEENIRSLLHECALFALDNHIKKQSDFVAQTIPHQIARCDHRRYCDGKRSALVERR